MADQEDRYKERRDRQFELLKHMSTLNVAALVLFAAFVENFVPVRPATTKTPFVALILFGVSLLASILGLWWASGTSPEATDEHVFTRFLIFIANFAFLVAMYLAITVGVTTL